MNYKYKILSSILLSISLIIFSSCSDSHHGHGDKGPRWHDLNVLEHSLIEAQKQIDKQDWRGIDKVLPDIRRHVGKISTAPIPKSVKSHMEIAFFQGDLQKLWDETYEYAKNSNSAKVEIIKSSFVLVEAMLDKGGIPHQHGDDDDEEHDHDDDDHDH